MTGRPTDWHVLDLDADPTPGAPLDIRDLARRLLELGVDASDAASRFRRAGADEAVASWIGLSGDAYRAEIGAFPGDLDKLSASYGMAGRALTA
ncbi:MAG: putative T7SS-secreted protein, partial [Frankia sp.]